MKCLSEDFLHLLPLDVIAYFYLKPHLLYVSFKVTAKVEGSNIFSGAKVEENFEWQYKWKKPLLFSGIKLEEDYIFK